MPTNQLTSAACKSALPREKVYYLNDGGGLRLQVHPNGSKYWMMRYRLGGKESTYVLGTFPALSLSEARIRLREAKQLVDAGRSPSVDRRIAQQSRIETDRRTFSAIADEWLVFHKPEWSSSYYERNEGLLRRFLLPHLGKLPADEITEPMLLKVLQHVYAQTPESARRARQVAAQIYRFGKDSHLCESNPASDLARSSRLKPVERKPFAALPKTQVGPFLHALANGNVEHVTRVALLAALLTGLRDHAIRGARWSEIDLMKRTWTVPATRMKRGKEFVTPLPPSLVEALEGLRPLTDRGSDSFVFSSYGKHGYIAENSLRVAMHRLGFKFTVHGFRSLMTDVLNENRWNADAIERQLDHVVANSIRRHYLRSDFWEERVKMLEWYADWCSDQHVEVRGKRNTNVALLRHGRISS